MPLERDEGEFAYMGQLILRGEQPYVAAYTMKLPGVYYAYAGWFALFGETDIAVRLGLLLVNLAAILLLYRLGRALIDTTAGVSAAAAYAMLSLSDSVLGLAGKAEHLVVVFVLAGALALVGGRPPRRLAATAVAGLLLGVAFLMKQHAAIFIAFGGAVVVLDGDAGRRGAWRRIATECALFGAAALLPFALTCAGMYRAGIFPPFWFWTFIYAREYVSILSLAEGWQALRVQLGRLLATSPALWLLAAVGATALWWDERTRRAARFLALFALCSVLSVCPGLRFSEHYFIMLLPAASLLIGAAVSGLGRRAAAGGPALAAVVRTGVLLAAVALALLLQWDRLVSLSPVAVSRAIYGVNPFPEAVEIARYLRAHAGPDDRVAVVGSEPEIYFYAQRPAATGYIYMYPLMEPHPFARHMQEDMIAQIDGLRPRYVVLVNVDTSWTRRADSHDAIFQWAERVVNADYDPVGVTEITMDHTEYRWDAEARGAMPRTASYVLTFERRS